MSITNILADEIYRTIYEDIPERTVNRMKRMMLDHVGLVYMGFDAAGKQMIDYAKDVSNKGEAVIIRDGTRISCELAAGLNAQMTKDTDFEEAGPGLHAGPGVVHTALAVGQRMRSSGREVLTAACLGYEINCRLHYARKDPGIPLTRHLGLVMTIVAAKLLGLNPQQLNYAIGLSARWLVQKKPFKYKQISPLGIGNLVLCRYGIQSALLAHHGFRDLTDYLDEYGDELDHNTLAVSPAPFSYTAEEMQLKPWPASRFCHGAVQLSGEIVNENGLNPEDIDKITFKGPVIYTQPHQFEPNPQNYWEGIYSSHWSITMGVLGIEPGPKWFTQEQLSDKRARDALKKVHIVEDPEATAIFNRGTFLEIPNMVEIEANGNVYTKTIKMGQVLGSPDNPMPSEMVESKFLRLTRGVMGEGKATKLMTKLGSIEEFKDINELAKLF